METRMFTAAVVLIGIAIVGIVAYDIYLHPPDPEPAGTATIQILGNDRFTASVGTLGDEHSVKDRAPFTFETDYRYADYVVATINNGGPGTLTARIQVKGETVDERQIQSGGRIALMWKAPRSP
jgi:hypothetical protein